MYSSGACNISIKKMGNRYPTFGSSIGISGKNNGFPILYKDNYISKSSVDFHRISAAEMKRYEIFLYLDGYAECGDQW